MPKGYTMKNRGIGGYIERVKVRYDGRVRDAYVNVNGYAEGLPYNIKATAVLAPPFEGKSIIGPLVIWVPDSKDKKSKASPPASGRRLQDSLKDDSSEENYNA